MAAHTGALGGVDPWLKPLRPSDALVWAAAQAREEGYGIFRFIGWGLVLAFLAWLFLLGNPKVSTVLFAAAALLGLQLLLTCHKRGPQGWVTERIAGAFLVGFTGLGTIAMLGFSQYRWVAVASILAAEGFSRRPEAKAPAPPWWSHQKMAVALVTATILKMVKVDGVERLPTLHYPGHYREDEYGVWQPIELPPGTTFDTVRKNHTALASAMKVPAQRLYVEQDPDKDANVVTFAVLKERKADPIPAVIPERYNFREPIFLGNDRLGRPVYAQTVDTHTMTVGKTRSGKTWLARLLVAHALMDPSVPVWMISGKDAAGDWRAMADYHLCVRYETVKDLAGVAACLDEVEAEATRRESLDRGTYPMGVLMVDEWARIIGNATDEDPALAKALDRKMTRLAAILAGFDIHVIHTFQRGTGDYIKTGLRANIGQRFVGITGNKKEVGYVMDMEHPPMAYPNEKRQGEFLISCEDSEPVLVRVPFLDNDGFREVCQRAARLRAAEPDAIPALQEDRTEPVYPEVPVEQDDPLTLAVWDVLRQRGPLSAEALLDALPEHLADDLSPVKLGLRLKAMEGVQHLYVEGSTGRRNKKVWNLVPHPHGAPGTPRWLLATGGWNPPEEQPMGLLEALTGTEDASPRHLEVLP